MVNLSLSSVTYLDMMMATSVLLTVGAAVAIQMGFLGGDGRDRGTHPWPCLLILLRR
jgi:hypothetical protein